MTTSNDPVRITEQSRIDVLPWEQVDGGRDVRNHLFAEELWTVGEIEAMSITETLERGFSKLECAVIQVTLEIAERIGDDAPSQPVDLSAESSIDDLPWRQFGRNALSVRKHLRERLVRTVGTLETLPNGHLIHVLGLGIYECAIVKAVLVHAGRVDAGRPAEDREAPRGALTTGFTTKSSNTPTSSRRNTGMATATSHHDKKITDADFSTIGDRLVVLVTLEDGSNRRLLDVPTGRVYVEKRNLVGRTFSSAERQVLCWLEAADDGIHRIVGIDKIGPIDSGEDLGGAFGVQGNYELVVRMSDGNVKRAFAFYDDELRLTEEDAKKLLDLSLKQAVEFKVQLDHERVPDGINRPDYSRVFVCLCCGNRH